MEISFDSSTEYSGHGRENLCGDDLAAVSRADLRWYYFLGALRLTHAGVDIGPPWGWVPLFDAMYCLEQVMLFSQGGQGLGRIDFTENDESIDFELDRNFGSLRVIPSYLECAVVCTVDEFVAAGGEFIRRELGRVVSEYPSLAGNPHVQVLKRAVGLEGSES
ncbi:hypothetical protein OG226_01880 [Streptomyces sp. NBC_01261]|uniref:hypothetical protein n=1 Tax=Streptomyces sp. NBC_01261 TaxID=2903802 RepID=UPI002E2EFEC5|nr:hypothetical protein [Streptomyces sp. NBC_01261]